MDKPAGEKTDAYGGYLPDPEQMALWPEISGNAINGLGERRERRPSHVYWHDPAKIAHGRLQQWFYARNNADAFIEARDRRIAIADAPLPSRAPETRIKPAAARTGEVADLARELSAEDVGIARMNPAWVFDDSRMDLEWIIVVAIAMDYERISQAPAETAGIEVIEQYGRCNLVANGIAGWLHGQGYRAEILAGPGAGAVTLIPAAIAAGLGELGKHGSMIHPRLGSCFRLSAVATDMPLVASAPREFGADEFCVNCRSCSNACPTDAIFADKQRVRGIDKWYVDFDRCLPYFNETMGCGICVAVCPWSRPGVADNLVVKLARKRASPAPVNPR